MKKWMDDFDREAALTAIKGNDDVSLNVAFSWMDTPEGYKFWDAQSDKLTPKGKQRLLEMIAEYDRARGEAK